METLRLSSCMAPNMDFIGRTLAAYLADRLDRPVVFVGDIPWQQREEQLDAGQIHGCWICGLPYVWKADADQPHIELLTAPVMQGARYEDRPVYFSDVVVRVDSPFRTFADLRGASWAYNEPGSHSGYNITRYHLSTLGETSGYFGEVVGSGAHEISLQMILDRQIDASAIDSTVLEMALRDRPEIQEQIRVIETLGPSSIPPWVVSTSLPAEDRQALQNLMLGMHQDSEGRAILESGLMARFAQVTDQDYDDIRRMDRLAQAVLL